MQLGADAMHPLDVRAQVVQPVEAARAIVALVLQEVRAVDGAVPTHRVRRRELLQADVALQAVCALPVAHALQRRH